MNGREGGAGRFDTLEGIACVELCRVVGRGSCIEIFLMQSCGNGHVLSYQWVVKTAV